MKRLSMLLILLLFSFGQSLDAQGRKKPQDSLPDTVYLLNHYQKSPQWKHSTLRAKAPANAPPQDPQLWLGLPCPCLAWGAGLP